mmetsp:Transcript_36082/g.103727  ORF Transcript_36082/g.103727 Transcript_36082/m.103727 type:complete len:251 (-) Transcript_36082:126-878(-)
MGVFGLEEGGFAGGLPGTADCAKAALLEDDPEHLLCPITFTLLRDPVVVVASGNTYERAAILEHWSRRGLAHDPLSNQDLDSEELVTNWGKRREVQAHLAARGPGYVPAGWESSEVPAPAAPSTPEGSPRARGKTPRRRRQQRGFFQDDDDEDAPWPEHSALVAIFPSFIVFQSWMVMGGWLSWWRGGGSLQSTKGVVGLSHCVWTLGLSVVLGLQVPISRELRWEYLMAMFTGVVHGLLTRAACAKASA